MTLSSRLDVLLKDAGVQVLTADDQAKASAQDCAFLIAQCPSSTGVEECGLKNEDIREAFLCLMLDLLYDYNLYLLLPHKNWRQDCSLWFSVEEFLKKVSFAAR